jgi:hypothetical protein
MVPMDIEKLTIKEFFVILKPNGGLNKSRSTPGTSQGRVPSDKPRHPIAGRKEYRDHLANPQHQSRCAG